MSDDVGYKFLHRCWIDRSLLVTAARSFGGYMVYGHIEAWSSSCRPFMDCLRGATLVKWSILAMNKVVIVGHCRLIWCWKRGYWFWILFKPGRCKFSKCWSYCGMHGEPCVSFGAISVHRKNCPVDLEATNLAKLSAFYCISDFSFGYIAEGLPSHKTGGVPVMPNRRFPVWKARYEAVHV